MKLFRFRTLPAAAALIAAASFISPPVAFANSAEAISRDSGTHIAVTAELKDLRARLAELNKDADRLESFANGPRLNWQTHAWELEKIKTHVNVIGEQLASLENMTPMGALWQQQTMQRVLPVAVELAERTTAAINHLSENQNYLWAPHYVDNLRAISDLSDHMHGTVSNYLKIMDAQNQLNQLDVMLSERVS